VRKRHTLLILLVACAALLSPGCTSNGTDGQAAAPAAAMVLGSAQVFDFDGEPLGKLPAGWKVEGTRSGTGGGGAGLAEWAVVGDASAPSGSQVLAVTASRHGEQDTFNLCWTDQVAFRDGRLRVSVKAVSGDVDRGGGSIWRVQGRDDYMLCRYNPLEQNFRVYRVYHGVRTQLDSERIDLEPGTWHVIEVVQAGRHVTCTLDGRAQLEADDDLLPAAGGVGLWTKADALTAFDDLRVEPAAH
jgi:hypothetical protein